MRQSVNQKSATAESGAVISNTSLLTRTVSIQRGSRSRGAWPHYTEGMPARFYPAKTHTGTSRTARGATVRRVYPRYTEPAPSLSVCSEGAHGTRGGREGRGLATDEGLCLRRGAELPSPRTCASGGTPRRQSTRRGSVAPLPAAAPSSSQCRGYQLRATAERTGSSPVRPADTLTVSFTHLDSLFLCVCGQYRPSPI